MTTNKALEVARESLTAYTNNIPNGSLPALKAMAAIIAQALQSERALADKLAQALDRAHDDMGAWQSYSSSYFLDKHGADDDLKSISDALAAYTKHKEQTA